MSRQRGLNEPGVDVHNLLGQKDRFKVRERSNSPCHAANNNMNSPRLSRKAITSLGDTEKSGVALNSPWTLWLDKSVPNSTTAQYEANLRKIYTVSTIESFWGVFNNIPAPNELVARYSYHMMRNNIRPVWEDKNHESGGMWKLRCRKGVTDGIWRELVLACIGEQFSESVNEDDEILGLSVSVRKNDDLIQLWNMKAQGVNEKRIMNKVMELVPDANFETTFYKPHHQHRTYEVRKY